MMGRPETPGVPGKRPLAACLPLYPPLELIHSFGFTPVVLWDLRERFPGTPEADRRLQSYTCSVARRLTEAILAKPGDFAAVFFYNACDTLRNLPEILVSGMIESGGAAPCLLRLHLPASDHEQEAAKAYLRNEIENLVAELETLAGVPFSRDAFRKSVSLFREMRSHALRAEALTAAGRLEYAVLSSTIQQCGFLPVEELTASLASLCDNARFAGTPGIPVMVSGILPPPDEVITFIEDAGLTIAANDIAAQGRSYKTPLPESDDPVDYYLEYYATHYPCTTLLHTSDRRIKAVMDDAREKKVRGFIFIGEKFCEYEYFEIVHLEKKLAEAGIATLRLEFSPHDGDGYESVKTRVEAFAEVLGK